MKLRCTRPNALAVLLVATAIATGADNPPKPSAAIATTTIQSLGVNLPAGVLAVVNGEPIQTSEVEEAFARAATGRRMPLDTIPAEQKQAAMRLLLNDLINERLVNKQCASVRIEEAAVAAEYDRIRSARGITDDDWKKELTQMGMTIDALKADILARLRQRLWMDEQVKGRTTEVTESDAKEFFEKNSQQFEIPEQVRASHILIRLPPDPSPEQVAAALKKARLALERAGKEDFEKLVAELSEEPGAASRSGDLSFFPRQGVMPEPLAGAAFKLNKGQVAPEPIRTQHGWHIIKVTDRKTAGKQTFDEVKLQILDFLARERKRMAIEEVIGALRAKANVQFSEAATEQRASVTPSSSVTPLQK